MISAWRGIGIEIARTPAKTEKKLPQWHKKKPKTKSNRSMIGIAVRVTFDAYVTLIRKFAKKYVMVLERTANEVIIRLPANINWEDLELMIRFIKYRENVSKSKAKQEDIDKLAREVNKQWWEENKDRFLKQP